MDNPDKTTNLFFNFFNEIAILGQLSGRLLEQKLPDGFLVSHFAVLNHLVRRGDKCTPLALARAFQVPKTTMTHTLAGLEKAGLVLLTPNPKDGRSKCVILTDEGRKFRDDAITRLTPHFTTMAKEINIENIAKILPILQEMREYLDEKRSKD